MKKQISMILSAAFMLGIVAGCATVPQQPPEQTLPSAREKEIAVYLIAGQSNALGCTATERLDAEYKRSYDDVLFYCNGEGAQENYDNHAAHNRWTHVQTGFGVNGESFGLEIGMADVLSGFYPADEKEGEAVAIVKYAWGGTGLAKRWLSPGGYPAYANSYEEGGRYVGYNGKTVGDLYANFMETVRVSLSELKGKGYRPQIKGLAWMQGCDDACQKKNAENYEAMLTQFIADVRADLNVADLPVAIGQINVEITPFGDTVRMAQANVAANDPDASFVYSRDLNMKTDDWWHFDSNDIFTLGRRFAGALVNLAEKPIYVSVDQASFAVSAGSTLPLRSATDRTFLQYSEAVTADGKTVPTPLTYSEASRTFAEPGDDKISATIPSGEGTLGVTVTAAVGSDPVADGNLSDGAWLSCNQLEIGDRGSYVMAYAGDKGVYLAANIVDTSVMNQWYDGSAWDPYLENDQVKFYLYTGQRSQGNPDEHSFAFYLTASNVLRVYRGQSNLSWDGVNHYGRYERGYYGALKHKVTVKGTPFNATDDVDEGYIIELFVPYSLLEIGKNESSGIKINCAYEDKRDYEIPHTTYQLCGGLNEYDDISIYKPITQFLK